MGRTAVKDTWGLGPTLGEPMAIPYLRLASPENGEPVYLPMVSSATLHSHLTLEIPRGYPYPRALNVLDGTCGDWRR